MPRDKKRGKGGKFKKGGKNQYTLTDADTTYLASHTNYGEEEIREWFSGFIEDNPTGTMGKDKMLEMYSSVLSPAKAKIFVDQIFGKFDADNSGSIDFKEFMLATNLSESGTPEDKLRWAFKMYDKDGSGTIDVGEMVEIVGNLYELDGTSKDTAEEQAMIVFRQLDINNDGELNEDEFVAGCMKDASLLELLNNAQ